MYLQRKIPPTLLINHNKLERCCNAHNNNSTRRDAKVFSTTPQANFFFLMEEHTPTAHHQVQRQARQILLRLPGEILLHLWKVVLRGQEPLDTLKLTLKLAPEVSWSLQIITDDVQRCISTYQKSHVKPRIIGLDEHDKQMTLAQWVGKLQVRVLVLFHCGRAVTTGELNAYEGCRYARLFFSPCVDTSFCILCNHQTDGEFTEELLLRFQEVIDKKPKTNIHIIHSVKEEEHDAIHDQLCLNRGSSTGDRYSTYKATETRSRNSQRVTDLRVHFSPTCITKRPYVFPFLGGPGPRLCYTPSFCLEYSRLAPQLHISFSGFRFPSIQYGWCREHDTHERILARVDEFKSYRDSRISFSNLNWSLTTPRGAAPCEHATSMGYHDQAGRGYLTNLMRFTGLYKSAWYYGVSDGSMFLMGEQRLPEEIVWFRLSPNQFNTLESDSRNLSITPLRSLKRLAIFSELRKDKHDLETIPVFTGVQDMDYVQLVALEGRDQTWDVHCVLAPCPFHEPRYVRLKTLELLQLRRSSTDPCDTSQLNRLKWNDISLVAPLVQGLIVGGYVPEFALQLVSNSPHEVFRGLELLCLDISTIITIGPPQTVSWYQLYLPETRFPRLRHLYLQGSMSMLTRSTITYLELEVTQACTTLDLSSVIRAKALVNDELLEIPDIAIVPDTFNRWRLSGEEYVYRGTGHCSFITRLEEVDSSLRPI